MTALIFAIGMIMTVASPARADSVLCTGNSYSDCINKGYTDHGYGANSGTSYWTMYAGHNCTNYAAYMASQNGAPTPNYNLGSALTWASQAASHGVPVNSTPAVGAIAQWDAWAGYAGSSGHVAYVEAVTSNSITISEDNFASGPFSWKTITAGSSNWPSNFIHFADVPTVPSDLDGDGTPDSSDSCPTVYGSVSNFGCPHQTIQMVGDVNNDGYDDVVALYRKDDGSVNVQRFPGSASGLQSPVLDEFLSTWSWSSTKVGGLSDIDGDGYADLVVFHLSGAGGTNVWRLPGSAAGFQAPVLEQYLSNFAWEDIKVGGLNDINGDNLADLAFFYKRGDGSTNVWRTPGTATGLTGGMFLDQIRTSWAWNDIKSGGLADINNDGLADLVALYRSGNGTVNVWRFPANSNGLQSPWLDQNLEGHAWVDVKAAGIDDVNGDGHGDVVIFYRTGTGAVNVWRMPSNSNGIQDTGATPDRSLTSWGWTYIKATGLGDVNGDGYADAVALYKTGTGAVNVWRLPGGSTVLQQPSAPDVTPSGWVWNNVRA